MKKFYLVVQDGKTLWFTGETEKQLEFFLQYFIDCVWSINDLSDFEVWEVDRLVMEPGADQIIKTKLEDVAAMMGITPRSFEERMKS